MAYRVFTKQILLTRRHTCDTHCFASVYSRIAAALASVKLSCTATRVSRYEQVPNTFVRLQYAILL